MEKKNNSKTLVLIALLIGVVGLSIGFAAYTATLNISSSSYVNPTEDFEVYFSTTVGDQVIGSITPVVSSDSSDIPVPTGEVAALSETTITGLKANFTEPGQTVTYSFYAHNTSDYVAYLNQVVFAKVDNDKTKVCTAKNSDTIGVDDACGDISIAVNVGNDSFYATDTNVEGHSLGKGAYEEVIVTITYSDNNNRANGDFDVTFGDISFTYNVVE